MTETIEEEEGYHLVGAARVYGEISDEILDRKVTVAIGYQPGKKDEWKNVTHPIEKLLLSCFSQHKPGIKQGQSILQGENSGGLRTASAMVALDFLFIDVDNGISRDAICGTLMDNGLFGIVYSTFNSGGGMTPIKVETLVGWAKKRDPENYTAHKPTLEEAIDYLKNEKSFKAEVLETAALDHFGMDDSGAGYSIFISHAPIDKTRVILLLKETFMINERGNSPKEGQLEWSERYRGVCDALGIPFDISCRDVSRLFYLPRHRPGSSDHHIIIIAGETLDLLKYERATSAKDDPFSAAAASWVEGERGGRGGAPVKVETQVDTVLMAHPKGLRFADLYQQYAERSRTGDGGIISGICPFDDDHSDAGNSEDYGFFCKNGDGEQGYVAGCMHDTCKRNHGNSRGETDRFKFASRFCANHGISGADLKEWVDLQENERWCLAPVSMQQIAKAEEYDPEEDAQGEDAIEDDAAFTTQEEAEEAIAQYEKTPEASREAAEILIRKLGYSGFEARVQIDGYLKRVAKHCQMMPKAAAKLYEEAETDRANSGKIELYKLTPKQIKELREWNREYAEITAGGKHRVLKEPVRSEGDVIPLLLSYEDFGKWHGSDFMKVPKPDPDADADEKLITVETSKVWHAWKDRRKYVRLVFEPSWSKGRCKALNVYNIWRGLPPIAGSAGSWSLLHDHIRDNICQGNDEYFCWVLTWLAHIFQYPGEKEQASSCVAIRGERGTGKSKVFAWVRAALGKHAAEFSQQAQIVGQFNGHQEALLLMVCEEAYWAGSAQALGAIKNLISSSTMSLERKGFDAIQISNHARIVLLSNERWFVPAAMGDERRFMVLECGNDKKQNIPYFKRIDAQMADGGLLGMREFLRNWDPRRDFGGRDWDVLRDPPKTPWLIEQANETLEPWDRFFVQLILDGVIYSSEQEKTGKKIGDIVLLPDQETMVSGRMLRHHFDQYTQHSRHGSKPKGNLQLFDDLLKKYLSPTGEEAVMLEVGPGVTPVTENCYKLPPLPQLKARMEDMNIKFGVNDNKKAA